MRLLDKIPVWIRYPMIGSIVPLILIIGLMLHQAIPNLFLIIGTLVFCYGILWCAGWLLEDVIKDLSK